MRSGAGAGPVTSGTSKRTGLFRRRPAWHRPALAAAALLALAALLLPPAAIARLLLGTDADPAALVAGLRILKAVLLLHAALFAFIARVEWNGEEGAPPLLAWQPEAGTAPRGALVALTFLLAVSFGLRLIELGSGIWFDEIYTLLYYVGAPFGRMVATFDTQNQHPLYSLLAKGTTTLFGMNTAALRLPAALLGVASIAATYAFGRQLGRTREALLAAAFLTFSYHHVWFSQNARGYTGLLLFTLLSTGLFLRLLWNRSPRGWALPLAYAVAMALCAYTHATGVFVAFGHVAAWLWCLARPGRPAGDVPAAARVRPFAALVLAATFTLLIYAALLPQLVTTLTHPTPAAAETEWQSPLWLLAETLRGLGRGVPGGLLSVAVGGLVFVAGLVSYARRSMATVLMMTVPIAMLAATLVALEHNLWPRFFLFAAGFGALIVMRGFATLATLLGRRGPQLALAVSVLFIAASAATVPRAWAPKQDFAGARAYIESEMGAGDAVVTLDVTDIPYRSFMELDWYAVASAAELLDIERGHARTWVVYTFPTRLAAVHADVWERLQSEYRTAAEFPGTVGGGAIIVKVRG